MGCHLFLLLALLILLRLLVNEDPEAGIHDEYLCRGATVDVARRERKEHPAREALEDRVVEAVEPAAEVFPDFFGEGFDLE